MAMIKSTENKLKVVLFFLAFLIYANTISHDYAWDDSIVITENVRVQKGMSGIPDLFLKYNSDYKSDKYGYRPITLASFAIEYSFFKAKPHFAHFMNVLYFSILCLVLFNVLRRLFEQYSMVLPFVITLLFIVHPIHVEAVANIKSRDEIFAMLFSFLSLGQLLKYQKEKKWTSLVYCGILFLLAFLSKESAIAFLGVFVLTLIYLEGIKNMRSLVRPVAVVLGLVVISFVIVKMSTTSTLGVEASKGAGIYYESGIMGNSFFYSYNFSEKLANAFTLLLVYLKNFFVPTTQLYFYGYNQIPVGNWGQISVIFSALVHLGLLAFAIVKFKSFREISFAILFYFITIFVYLHIFRALADTLSDRFMFVPSLGLCILFVFAIAYVFKIDFRAEFSWDRFLGGATKATKKGVATPANYGMLKYGVVLLLLLAFKTYSRNKVWKNDETLIAHDMPDLENCSRAHFYYADILRKKMATAYNASIEADMIKHYKRSIEISKESYYAYLGLGTYLCDVKRYGEGVALLDSMVKIYPEQADPHFFLGQALYQTNKYDSAIEQLQRSVELAPEVLSTYYFLALSYSKKGNYEKALAIIETAKNKFSESGLIYDAIGNIYYDKGDMEQSTKETLKMLGFGEDPQRVYGMIIGRYQVLKQDSLAKAYYNEALAKGIFKR